MYKKLLLTQLSHRLFGAFSRCAGCLTAEQAPQLVRQQRQKSLPAARGGKVELLIALLLFALPLAACAPAVTTPVMVDITDVHQAVKDALGDTYTADMPLDKETFIEMFGVAKDDIDTFIAEMPGFSLSVDTFVAVKAMAGRGEAVEQALLAWRKFQIEEGFQYPMNMAKVKATQVVRHGDLVFLLMLGAFNEDQDADEEAQLEFAKAENQKAVDAVNTFFKS
jgi:hypothetical protein